MIPGYKNKWQRRRMYYLMRCLHWYFSRDLNGAIRTKKTVEREGVRLEVSVEIVDAIA